ncbi:hypothetical protein EDC01DRAFT_624021, partial [Geopyxis carbonaria]
MFTTSRGKFESLTRNNYSEWAKAIQTILELDGDWKYVNGRETCPTTTEGNATADQAAIDSFTMKQKEIALFLRSSVTEIMKHHIRGIEDPKAIWDILA